MDNPQGGRGNVLYYTTVWQIIDHINDLEALGKNVSNMMHTEMQAQSSLPHEGCRTSVEPPPWEQHLNQMTK